MTKPVYRRVVVKVSGESLMGPESFGIHQPTLDAVAAAAAPVVRTLRRLESIIAFLPYRCRGMR